jgi:hypothetical protein
VFSGFIFNVMVFTTFGSFVSVFAIRYIKSLLKASSFTRRCYFIFSDFLALRKRGLNIYAKYYL